MSTPAVSTHGNRPHCGTAVPFPACPAPHATPGTSAGAHGTGHTATLAAETRETV